MVKKLHNKSANTDTQHQVAAALRVLRASGLQRDATKANSEIRYRVGTRL